MATVATLKEMKLHAAGDDSRRASVIPILFNPQIVTMRSNRLLFSGLERQGNQDDPEAPRYWQEWSVEVLTEPPAELAETSHRPPG